MSQRWRLTVARGPDGAHVAHRDLAAQWEAIAEALRVAAAARSALGKSDDGDGDGERGRQVDPSEPSRVRVQFAAPLPTGMTADAELIDILLPGRLAMPQLRSIVESNLPIGHRLVDSHDIWMASASLPSLVIGAEYRAAVSGVPADDLRAAIARLFAAVEIARPGRDPGRPAANLRPLVETLVARAPNHAWPGGDAPPPDAAILQMRLRVDASLGSGRPEQVVEALAAFGAPLTLHDVHREAFCLKAEPRPVAPQPGTSRSRLRPIRRV